MMGVGRFIHYGRTQGSREIAGKWGRDVFLSGVRYSSRSSRHVLLFPLWLTKKAITCV